jgi:hypothetical protein
MGKVASCSKSMPTASPEIDCDSLSDVLAVADMAN